LLPLQGTQTPQPLIATRFNEQHGMFSPDGKWLAFTSDESGRNEIYLQPFGHDGVRSLVSTGGGASPMWGRDGKTLYHLLDNILMQVAFDSKTGNIGQPAVALRLPPRTRVSEVPADGKFIGVHRLEENTSSPELEIVTGWFRELSARVPVPHYNQIVCMMFV
jgi:eukaryotic-like serine/threonine-protein kinase